MNIKILQWNVLYKEAPERIASAISAINPDIICGQELMQRLGSNPIIDSARQVAEQIGYQYIYQIADTWTGRADKENQGNAIFSKFPIKSSSFIYLQTPKQNPPDPEHEGRVYLEVELDIHGKTLTVGTTHLSYSHQFQVTDHRKKEINNLLEILGKKQESFIFTGDLNSVPDSYTLQEIQKIEHFQSPGPSFDQKTWTTKPFDYRGFKEDKLNWRLDYVFATQDIQVVSSKIVETSVSDHLPILLEIEI